MLAYAGLTFPRECYTCDILGDFNSPLDLCPCMGDWDEGFGWKLYADAFKEASVVEKGIMIVLPLVGGIAFYSFLIMIS